MNSYNYEYTDTFAGDANYSWVKRGSVSVPELTHYGFDGSHGYSKANKSQLREVMRLVKREIGLTGTKGERLEYGDGTIEFRPCGLCTVLFIDPNDEGGIE